MLYTGLYDFTTKSKNNEMSVDKVFSTAQQELSQAKFIEDIIEIGDKLSVLVFIKTFIIFSFQEWCMEDCSLFFVLSFAGKGFYLMSLFIFYM